LENLLLFFGVLLICSILLSKISDRFGIPSLIVFLCVGMLAGSDGLLGVHFDDQAVAQNVGMLALIFILYAGGLDTDFSAIKPIFGRGLALATLGVILTALALAPVAKFLLGFSWGEALLLGAIVSSTDAAAVFAILRAKNISLKNNLAPLIELESGSNDPMAIFLTMSIISMISASQIPQGSEILLALLKQFGIGIAAGYLFGVLLPAIFNRLRLKIWGLYPVFSIAWILLLYTLCVKVGGNYAASLLPHELAAKRQFADAIYLDPKTHTKIEEVGAANFFGITRDNKFITPRSDSILPSITKYSLLHLAKERLGMETIEGDVYINELDKFAEAGACGTAAGISRQRRRACTGRADTVSSRPPPGSSCRRRRPRCW